MKKIIITLTVIVLIILIIIVTIFLRNRKLELTENNIKYIHFSYSTGNMMYANVSYEVNERDGKYIAKIKPNGKSEEEAKEIELSNKDMQKIVSTLNKYQISSWNNFHKNNKNILDGHGFSFELKTKDNKEISASGYMKWPKNYNEIRGMLDTIFNELYNESIVELTDIDYMYYTYSNGDEANAYTTYQIEKKDEKYIASIKPHGKSDKEKQIIELDEEKIKEILTILNKNQVVLWDEFHESDRDVLDGDSFSFSLKNDEINISASGYMKWPRGYRNIENELTELFNNLYKE